MTGSYCTVIIPTKNGMPGIQAVMTTVMDQRTLWKYDVLAIHSGSKDGTVEYLRALDGVRLVQIPPEEFGHGKTRNRAIAATEAPFVALLTQDALPANREWLFNLVSAVEQNTEIAGAFGRHLACENADPFTKRDLIAHFDGFQKLPRVVSQQLDPERYENDVGWRQTLHFFSDNNACLRRSVWERIPYPDADFAEDQLWAKSIIENGFSKAYAHEAAVYHSHSYGIWEKLQRSFDEARSFRVYFGYKLSAGVKSLVQSILWLIQRDFQDLRSGSVKGVSAGVMIKQIFLNVALVFGHYLGTNHASIPKKTQFFLSRDKRLQALR